ncbi:MAG: hypothetical protein KAU48_14045 [Candidatus Thorarchaeota archaeon]|nr:hypothetical protein [Candidatus Thorarchaeota archaeon]
MSTRHEFSKKAIQDFSNQYGVTITYSEEQTSKLTDDGRTPLLIDQISDIADQLCTDEASLKNFIEEITAKLHPISLSLYVLNDDLWKIMTRKHKLPDKMLPMITMPWFYWEKEAEERENLSGVRRKDDFVHPLTINIEKRSLKITGNGGDFCGLLEGRIVDRFKGVRPLLIPGDTGPKKTVPNYEAQFIQIMININSSETLLYPIPNKDLDYNFSEHPKVFYNHGIQIIAEGKDVVLKVGNRRSTELRGKVLIFIGKDFEQNDDSSNLLLFHIWLSILNRSSFR